MNRVSLLMKKLGCSFIFKDGIRIPITLLLLEESVVVSVKSVNEDLSSVAVMFGKKKNPNNPQKVCMNKIGIPHVGKIREFRINNSSLPVLKSTFDVSHFEDGSLVDAIGTSIGKGFAGVMKRHNFAGLSASHGVSIAHRSGGSIGQQDVGKTHKGKKMAGQMGNKRVTIQNLKVVYLDVAKNVVGVKGSVPGAKNSYVMLRDAVKG